MSKRVIIESPYAGDSPAMTERNRRYLRRCMRDCLLRGEAPFASHGLYTQAGVLDDTNHSERQLGIIMGFAWRDCAHSTVVYEDYGISSGMQLGIDHATESGCPVERRTIGLDSADMDTALECCGCGLQMRHDAASRLFCGDCRAIS